MPVLTQLKLNIGTEQNPNMVLHDLHDIRISSTDVTTVTRLLGCDAGVNSIAPLTLANAASLLGVNEDLNTKVDYLFITGDGWDLPSGYTEGIGITVKRSEPGIRLQIALLRGNAGKNLFQRSSWGATLNWNSWTQIL